jgi:hypothetical protein
MTAHRRIAAPDGPGLASGALDRRLSVAPMMDWSDDCQIVFCINSLALPRKACLLYVSSTTTFARIPVAG